VAVQALAWQKQITQFSAAPQVHLINKAAEHIGG